EGHLAGRSRCGCHNHRPASRMDDRSRRVQKQEPHWPVRRVEGEGKGDDDNRRRRGEVRGTEVRPVKGCKICCAGRFLCDCFSPKHIKQASNLAATAANFLHWLTLLA